MGDILGRDKYEQKGPFSKISVNNSRSDTKLKWYQSWWGILLIGVITVIIAAYFTNLLGLTK